MFEGRDNLSSVPLTPFWRTFFVFLKKNVLFLDLIVLNTKDTSYNTI